MSKPIPSKEQGLFRQVVQLYENKQYKKGLKTADQILKKHPDHGDTLAMKALIINSQGKTDEAFELAKQALKHAMKSHVCWHVYGLLYRAQKNYEEAIKAYKFALRLDPESVQIQRDLALLQVQMRDYAGYVQSRQAMLKARPTVRQNWTAVAIAHHLSGDLEQAENVLTTFEGTLKGTPPRNDHEHAGATLYKNLIIAEQGDAQKALDHLETIYKSHPDRTSVMELKAKYLLQLGKLPEAEKAYRKLLGRNAERRDYYQALEKSLGLDRSNPGDLAKLTELYKTYAAKSERIDAPRRIPLDFLTGNDFKEAADAYLRRMLSKGVPSTFANVKALYLDESKKQIISDLVHSYESENAPTDSTEKTNGDGPSPWKLAVLFFLAQHHNYHLCRDLQKALNYIDQCISLSSSPTEYTYQMHKARIHKHQGDYPLASKTMNEAREMDLKDRYINTKCAKYQLRADKNDVALETMSLFTRKDATGGALGDLLDMQCMWFLYEDGQSHARCARLGLALKRFHAARDIFDTWTDDQFDFHSFSLRKGMIVSYIDMIRWEDHLRSHPFYTRAAVAAVDVYLRLADQAAADKEGGEAVTTNGDKTSSSSSAASAEKKKRERKERKERERAEQERKAKEAAKAMPPAKKAAAAAAAAAADPDEDESKRKEDPDPYGAELVKTSDPLGEAMKFLVPVLEVAPEDVGGQERGVEVYLRRGKWLPALKCLLALQKLRPRHEKLAGLKARLVAAVEEEEAGAKEKENGTGAAGMPDEVRSVLEEGLAKLS